MEACTSIYDANQEKKEQVDNKGDEEDDDYEDDEDEDEEEEGEEEEGGEEEDEDGNYYNNDDDDVDDDIDFDVDDSDSERKNATSGDRKHMRKHIRKTDSSRTLGHLHGGKSNILLERQDEVEDDGMKKRNDGNKSQTHNPTAALPSKQVRGRALTKPVPTKAGKSTAGGSVDKRSSDFVDLPSGFLVTAVAKKLKSAPMPSGRRPSKNMTNTMVSGNFVKNNYKKKMRHAKRPKTSSEGNLGKRFRNGRLKVSKFRTKSEWKAVNAEKSNELLYADLLDESEMKAIIQNATLLTAAPCKLGQKRDSEMKASADSNGEETDEDLASLEKAMLQIDDATIQSMSAEKQRLAIRSRFQEAHDMLSSLSTRSEENGMAPPERPNISKDLHEVLRDVFGYSRFNDGQEVAIRNVVRGNSTLLILPTGGGKSLCYQLPAFLFPGMTLVVTPLISLMQDQLLRLPACLPGAFWNSQQTSEENLSLMAKIKAGEIKILFVSPEKLLTPGFQRFMKQNARKDASSSSLVSFACIDEAHCVSEWSHNFRPSYLRLQRVLKETLNVKTILALTATATRQAEMTVCASLNILPSSVFKQSVRRSNLLLSCSRDSDKLTALVHLLQSRQFRTLKSIIVYVMLQRDAESVASVLANKGFNAAPYHAGMSASQRSSLQEKFMMNKLRIVVATVAFGMGLDKQDIRAVIHFSLPRSMEHYVQEIGRAGRDGNVGICHTFYDEEDAVKMRSLANSDVIDRSSVKNVMVQIFGGKTVTPEGSFVAINIKQSELTFDVREQMLGTVLTHLEIMGDRGELEISSSSPSASSKASSTASSSTASSSTASPATSPSLICLVNTLHNQCKVGFLTTPLAQLAEHIPLIQKIWENNGLRTPEQMGGNFDVDICQLATQLNVHVVDVQRDLLKLKSGREISIRWEENSLSFVVQVVRQPRNFEFVVGKIAGKLKTHEATNIRKIDIVCSALKLVSVPSVGDALLKMDIMKKHLETSRNAFPVVLPLTTRPLATEGTSSVSANQDGGNELLRAEKGIQQPNVIVFSDEDDEDDDDDEEGEEQEQDDGFREHRQEGDDDKDKNNNDRRQGVASGQTPFEISTEACKRLDFLGNLIEYYFNIVDDEELRKKLIDVVNSSGSLPFLPQSGDVFEGNRTTPSQSFQLEKRMSSIAARRLEQQLKTLRDDLILFVRRNAIVTNPRAIARIAHGLHSPKYPASTWQHCGLWGRYYSIAFDDVLKVAFEIVSGGQSGTRPNSSLPFDPITHAVGEHTASPQPENTEEAAGGGDRVLLVDSDMEQDAS